jgi:hypothetical protein
MDRTPDSRAQGGAGQGGTVMKRKSFRPQVDAMEARVALSSSGSGSFFTSFFNSIFGKSTTSNSSTVHYTAAQIAKIKAHNAAMQQAREAKLEAFHAAHHQ